MTRLGQGRNAPSAVLEVRDDRVLWLTLNRASVHNALNRPLLSTLVSGLRRADSDPSVHVVVIDGAGPSFCSGGDLREFVALKTKDQARSFIELCFSVFTAIESIGKPIIAAVHGAAIGGGVELVAAADIVIAGESARFATVEPTLGLSPAYGANRLGSVIGVHNAKYLAMTGRSIDAEEALRMGLVSSVVPDRHLKEEARRIANDLSGFGGDGLRATKRIVNRTVASGVAGALEAAIELQLRPEVHQRALRLLGSRAD